MDIEIIKLFLKNEMTFSFNLYKNWWIQSIQVTRKSEIFFDRLNYVRYIDRYCLLTVCKFFLHTVSYVI